MTMLPSRPSASAARRDETGRARARPSTPPLAPSPGRAPGPAPRVCARASLRGGGAIASLAGVLVASATSGCGVVLGIDQLSNGELPPDGGDRPPANGVDPPRALWSYSFGSTASEEVDDIVSLEHSFVVTGSCGCTVDESGAVLGDAALRNPTMLGLTKDGGRLFARAFDTSPSPSSSLRVTNDGPDMILAGTFSDDIELAGSLTADGVDGFVAKGSGSSGDVLWNKQAVGSGKQRAFDLSGTAGTAYVVGSFEHEVKLAGSSIANTKPESMFVARFREAYGDLMWLSSFPGSSVTSGRRIAAQGDTAVVAGLYDGDFDLWDVGHAAGRGLFAAMIDGEGNPKWLASSQGTPENLHVSAVSFAPDGGVVLAGDFLGVLDFGARVEAGEAMDCFIVKLDANGKHLWTRQIGGGGLGGGQSCRDMRVDGDGNVLVVGDFTGFLQFGDSHYTADGTDGFIAKLAPNGDARWSRQLGGPGLQSAGGVTFDDDILIVAGRFDGTFVLENGELVSQGDEDIFVLRLDWPGP